MENLDKCLSNLYIQKLLPVPIPSSGISWVFALLPPDLFLCSYLPLPWRRRCKASPRLTTAFKDWSSTLGKNFKYLFALGAALRALRQSHSGSSYKSFDSSFIFDANSKYFIDCPVKRCLRFSSGRHFLSLCILPELLLSWLNHRKSRRRRNCT